MSNDLHDDGEIDLPVLEEVIRPAPEPGARDHGAAEAGDPGLQARVSAIIERHAREAIEEINALLQPREQDGG